MTWRPFGAAHCPKGVARLGGYVRCVSPCYNVHVENKGIAFQLWARVESVRLDQGWNATQMAEHIGLPRNTIRRLKTNPSKSLPATVHQIADGLRKLGVEITRREAETLAGLRQPEPGHSGYVSARDAIKADLTYTEKQREAMLEMAELFARTNQAARSGDSDAE